MQLVTVVTFFIAILSGLGVGSAGLLVTWLTVVEQLPQIAAQGMNLIFFIFSSGVALIIHIVRTPPLWQALPILLITGICGSFFGVALATALPQEMLRRIFGYMLIATGGFGLLKR